MRQDRQNCFTFGIFSLKRYVDDILAQKIRRQTVKNIFQKTIDKRKVLWYDILVANKIALQSRTLTEKSRSWSSAHDWKSCNRQKRFESSNLSFSAKTKITGIYL